jgi:sulfur carrier protein ThiS
VDFFRKNKVHVHLGGHLAFYHRQKQSWFDYELLTSVPLCQVVEQLGIPPAEIAFSIVNDKMADLEKTIVDNNDTVQFYPPIDGG